LAGVKARAIRFAGIPIRSEATPDQLAERYAESLGLTIRALAQFIWKQNGGAMHMALIASAYGGVNHRGKILGGWNHRERTYPIDFCVLQNR
jgi:hypothetical protein